MSNQVNFVVIKSSRWVAGCIVCASSLCSLAIWQANISSVLTGALSVFVLLIALHNVSLGYKLTDYRSIKAIGWDLSVPEITVDTGNEERLSATAIRHVFVSRWCVSAVLDVKGRKASLPLFLMADSVSATDFRRIKVMLNWLPHSLSNNDTVSVTSTDS